MFIFNLKWTNVLGYLLKSVKIYFKWRLRCQLIAGCPHQWICNKIYSNKMYYHLFSGILRTQSPSVFVLWFFQSHLYAPLTLNSWSPKEKFKLPMVQDNECWLINGKMAPVQNALNTCRKTNPVSRFVWMHLKANHQSKRVSLFVGSYEL